MKCYVHFIVDQAGTKSDCWQLGKVRLTRTQTVKEDPVAKECLAQPCNGYHGLEGQNIWNSGSQLGQICTPMSRDIFGCHTGGGVLLANSEWRPGMLQRSCNIGKPSITKKCPAQIARVLRQRHPPASSQDSWCSSAFDHPCHFYIISILTEIWETNIVTSACALGRSIR